MIELKGKKAPEKYTREWLVNIYKAAADIYDAAAKIAQTAETAETVVDSMFVSVCRNSFLDPFTKMELPYLSEKDIDKLADEFMEIVQNKEKIKRYAYRPFDNFSLDWQYPEDSSKGWNESDVSVINRCLRRGPICFYIGGRERWLMQAEIAYLLQHESYLKAFLSGKPKTNQTATEVEQEQADTL